MRLKKCLDHLRAQTVRDFDVVIVDNGSGDGSADLQDEYREFQFDFADANLGFAAGCNRGAAAVENEWLAFLNPDAYAAPSWIEAFLAGVEQYPSIDAFGSTQIDAHDPTRIDGAGDVCHGFGLFYRGHTGALLMDLPPEGEVFSACGAAAFYRRSTFERLGGFDERFFCYGEDVDLGFRLRRSGGRTVQLSGARVAHEGSAVAGRYSDFAIYHGVRNRIWVFGKNLPLAIYYGAAPLRFVINMMMLARAFFAGYGLAYFRGYRDGIASVGIIRSTHRRLGAGSHDDLLMSWSPLKLLTRKANIHPYSE